MDTGLTRKVYDILQDTTWSSDCFRDKCLTNVFSSLNKSCTGVGELDNGDLEGDFSLMQSIGQQVWNSKTYYKHCIVQINLPAKILTFCCSNNMNAL